MILFLKKLPKMEEFMISLSLSVVVPIRSKNTVARSVKLLQRSAWVALMLLALALAACGGSSGSTDSSEVDASTSEVDASSADSSTGVADSVESESSSEVPAAVSIPAAGSYMPTTANTGPNNVYVASQVALADWGGTGRTITVDGTVLENFSLNAPVTVKADNVTIRNFKINSPSFYGINASSGAKNLLIEDGEIEGAVSAGLYGGNLIARRLYIHNMGADAIKIIENSTVETSFITDVGTVSGAHADGIQMVSGGDVLVQGNHFEMPYDNPTYINSQAIIIQTNNAAVDGIQIINNWINGGGYSVQVRERNYGVPTNISLMGNKFGRDYQFGPWIIDGDATDGRVIRNNVWEDTGALIGGQD